MWPDVPDFAIAQLTFFGQANGQRIMNTFGYQADVTGAVQPADAVSNAFFASLTYVELEGDFLATQSTEYTLDEAWFQILFPTRIRKTILERDLPGTWDGPIDRQNTSAVISRHGAFASRTANGGLRLALPGNAGTAVTVEGLLTADYKVPLTALALTMLDSISTTVGPATYAWQPIIINPNPDNPVILSGTPVVATNVQPEARVMRRRTVGLGI